MTDYASDQLLKKSPFGCCSRRIRSGIELDRKSHNILAISASNGADAYQPKCVGQAP